MRPKGLSIIVLAILGFFSMNFQSYAYPSFGVNKVDTNERDRGELYDRPRCSKDYVIVVAEQNKDGDSSQKSPQDLKECWDELSEGLLASATELDPTAKKRLLRLRKAVVHAVTEFESQKPQDHVSISNIATAILDIIDALRKNMSTQMTNDWTFDSRDKLDGEIRKIYVKTCEPVFEKLKEPFEILDILNRKYPALDPEETSTDYWMANARICSKIPDLDKIVEEALKTVSI